MQGILHVSLDRTKFRDMPNETEDPIKAGKQHKGQGHKD